MDVARTIRLQGYGSQRVEGGTTIAYLNGDAPYIYVRTGSDAMKLPNGHCLPISDQWAAIVNPYPRQIEICIAQGLQPVFQTETNGFTASQAQIVNSYHYGYRDVPVPTTGKKFAIGVMMKRGEAAMYFTDQANNPNSKVMFFPGARADFMSFKPAGCMMDTISFIGSDGMPDNSAYTVGGYYDDSMVAAWVAAAGYGGQPITVKHNFVFQALSYYRAATDVAVFYIREPDTGVHVYARMQHLGMSLEDLD